MKPCKPTVEGRRAERALRRAVANVVEENRRLGFPVAVMRRGRAVLVSADQAVAAVRETKAAYSVKARK